MYRDLNPANLDLLSGEEFEQMIVYLDYENSEGPSMLSLSTF